ncbi:MAG TPA: septation protein SepH [Sporichthyaceae bacterium]|jgi:hypothetical protein|nr:septation protein SepH [Sporichthyaceae bacterium]
MQDLRLVAANERGSHLVLRSTEGEKYVVTIDERLRAAVGGDRSRSGPPAAGAGIDLRPREIQAQIRAGASAEEIAQAAGMSLERVRRFEGPVLAEREHVAQLAQRSTVRRPGLDTRPTSLGDSINERLALMGICADGLLWDSWLAEDGRWVVQVAYRQEDRVQIARYRYDLRARSVVAENDEARWLTGERIERPQPATFVPRLTPAEPAPQAAAEAAATSRAHGSYRRGAMQMEVPLPSAEDLVGAVGAAELLAPAVAIATPVAAPVPVAPDPMVAARSTGTDGTPPARAPRGRRAAVPAWDDIVFGSRRPE